MKFIYYLIIFIIIYIALRRYKYYNISENINSMINPKSVKIAFYSNHLCERGTEIALFDYAYYNIKLLNNDSIIIYNSNNINNNNNIIKKFKDNFNVFSISSDINTLEIDEILLREKCDILYMIISGEKIDLPKNAKVCIHCVFNCIDQPFGDVYSSISPIVHGNNGRYPVVPHMINLPSHTRNLRKKLLIPESATVFGRYGGQTTFNIEYVKNIVCEVAEERPDIYFLFVNTYELPKKLPNIIYLDTISNLDEKVEFINTCDAMLWARADGETFGLAIGEFSSKNKPVFATDIGDRAHVMILKDKGIWYTNDTLKELLLNFNKNDYINKDVNAYKDYSPELVMQQFKKVFID